MRYPAKITIGALLLVVLAGCASPRYQTLYRYEPPTEPAGLACLTQCEQKLSGCKNQCAETRQACLKSIEPLVEARFQQNMQQYQKDLHFYQHALDLYQRQLSFGWRHYDPYYGGRPYYPGFDSRFPPSPPLQPKREQIAKQLAQQQCDRDCGCQSLYDACFLSCGGKKIPEVKCIAHCPPEK